MLTQHIQQEFSQLKQHMDKIFLCTFQTSSKNFGDLFFGWAYYWREFCVSQWVGLDNKNSLKHLDNSQTELKTYFQVGLHLGGLIIGILHYLIYSLLSIIGTTFFVLQNGFH